jgi:hypothetical protein
VVKRYVLVYVSDALKIHVNVMLKIASSAINILANVSMEEEVDLQAKITILPIMEVIIIQILEEILKGQETLLPQQV